MSEQKGWTITYVVKEEAPVVHEYTTLADVNATLGFLQFSREGAHKDDNLNWTVKLPNGQVLDGNVTRIAYADE